MTQAERDEIRALVLSFSTKISDLPEVEALQDGDYVVVVQNDGSKKHSKKATLESLLELIKIYYPDHNGAKYQGVAHPNDNIVNLPIGTDGFWFAIDAGVYTNYGGIVVGNSPKTLLYNAETHEWTSEDLWGDINGTVGFRLMDSSIENSLETFRIPVIQNRPYIISANARPSGSFAVLNIYEYDYTGELIGSIGYHVPEHSFTPREGTAYIKIGLGYNSSNPIAVELSEVRVTSSIKTLIEGLTDFVVDVLQGEYATHFGNIEDNINAILYRVGVNEANIATLQQGVSELGTGLDSLSSRTGIIAGDVAQLVIDTSGISARLENTEQDVHELSITASGLDERITNNQNDIFSLSTRADGLEVEVQNAKGDITDLQVTAQGLDARIANAQGDVDELEITARGLSQRVSNAEGDIHTLESTATTLESNIGAVDGRVSTLSQTVERIDARVENQSGQIAGLSVEAGRIDLYAQGIAEDLGNYETFVNGALQDLENQIDGAIDTWFYPYAPVQTDEHGAPTSEVPLVTRYDETTGEYVPVHPYYDWYTEDQQHPDKPEKIRDEHVSDIFYDQASGYAYRFIGTGEAGSRIYTWAAIADSAVIRALQEASEAYDLADNKRRVFIYSQAFPTPYAPYDPGDLWVKPVTIGTGVTAQTATELYRCKTQRARTTDVFPFNPAVNTDTTSAGCDWEPADSKAEVVTKSNLQVLSDAIVGQSTQITYNADGTIASQSTASIATTAGQIRLNVANGAIDTAVGPNGKITTPLLGTGIDIINGDITLIANHIALKNQNNQTALELITIGSGQDTKVLIDVGSLNVSGIFTTSAWSTQENALHGYSDTAAGNAYTNAVAQAATDAASYITTNVSPLITNAQTTADNAATAAGNAQTTANNAATAAGNAQTAVNGMAYLATALANGTTAIGGGLVLSSLIGVGGNTGAEDAWELWGGIRALSSGEANTGIAAWYGGDAVDCTTISGWESMSAAQKEQAWSTYRYARSLFRHDGSGYLASGEIAWGKNGDIVLHGVGIETPVIAGGSIGSTTEVTDGTTTFTVADLIELKSWFQKATYTDGTGTHTYLRLVCSPGTIEGLAADGFISAGGISPGGGTSGIDLDAMWTSLTTTSDSHGTDKIAAGHIPDMSSTYGYLKSADLSAYATRTWVGQNYLPLTGGKIQASSLSPLIISAYGMGNANYLQFNNGNTVLGYLGMGAADSPVFRTAAGTNYTLLHANNYDSYALPKSGGTISNANYGQILTVYRNSASGDSTITFQNSTSVLGYIGVTSGGVPCFRDTAASPTTHTILHSGNYSSYALPLTGGTMSNTNVVTNLNADLLDGQHGSYYNNLLAFYDSGATSADSVTYPLSLLHSGTPSSAWWYVTTMYYSAVGSAQASQIATSYNASEPQMYIRQKYNSTWSSWRGVYHSGNSNKSDVAWACSGLTIGDFTSATNPYIQIDHVYSTNYRFFIQGYQGTLRIGPNNYTSTLCFDYSGNIGVYTSSPTKRLDVNGDASFASAYYNDTNPALGALNVGTISILGRASNGARTNYGLYCWIDVGYGSAKLQVGRQDSNTATYALCLNPLGGNIGVGTNFPYSKVEINGTFAAPDTTSIVSTSMLTIGQHNNDSLCFGVYPGANSNAGWIQAAYYGTSTLPSSSYARNLILNPIGGNVGIGTSSPAYKLDIIGDLCVNRTDHAANNTTFRISCSDNWVSMYAADPGDNYCNLRIYLGNNVRLTLGDAGDLSSIRNITAGGNIVASGAVTGGQASDARLKTNINTMTDNQAKAMILALRPVTFTWNQKATELYDQYQGNDLGFIAQEVELIPGLSKAIGTIFEDYKRLDPVKFIAPMVKVAQNHEARIQQLERELAQVKSENKQLRNRLNMS